MHHALHTPLMSVTNAISGIIVVGALLQIGHDDTIDHRALSLRGDPAGQHQHLRWLRGDPPHARHVLDGAEPAPIGLLSPDGRRRRPTSSRAAVHPGAWPGCPSTRPSRAGNTFGIAAWPSRWSRPSRWRSTAHVRAAAAIGRCWSAPMAIGAAIGLWRARVRRDDRHARADRAAALLRRSGRGAGRLERLPARRGDRGGASAELALRPARHPLTPRSFIGVFIGAVTFTGSIVAFLKLSARIKSNPLMLPGQELAQPRRAGAVRRADGVVRRSTRRSWLLIAVTVVALALGWHLVASIGGGDMPVVVSMLNSYSGWAAAASGFLLDNDLLIITGALVGSSGAYLSYIMCKAMNRSFISVIAGGFGIEAGPPERHGLRRAPRDHRRGRRRLLARRRPRCHHPRLRHGRRAGAVPGRRADPQAARDAASTSGSASTRSPAACPGT